MIFSSLGDNMLTAVNVAKSCHLVEPVEKVFFVNASPPTYNSSATLKFIPAEATAAVGEEPREVSVPMRQYGSWISHREDRCTLTPASYFSHSDPSPHT